jgi:diaminopimelate decarboxylase
VHERREVIRHVRRRKRADPAGTGDLLAVVSAAPRSDAGLPSTRPLIPEVLVRAAEWAPVRPRLDADELIRLDRLPSWLA